MRNLIVSLTLFKGYHDKLLSFFLYLIGVYFTVYQTINDFKLIIFCEIKDVSAYFTGPRFIESLRPSGVSGPIESYEG